MAMALSFARRSVCGIPSLMNTAFRFSRLDRHTSCETLVRREGFEPPAFWSVGCLTHKSGSFRLRFVLFATVRSADFPLFPSSPACSGSVLGQKWVKDRCMVGEFEQSVRIHTERLIGQQLFLPKGLRLNHFIGRHGLWQELQKGT